MRIWSVHPQYLDTKGLLALWRESLLAKNVLEGKTIGYINHPQLNRFKKAENPLDCINQYLSFIYSEALKRGYNFDKNKVDPNFKTSKITVTVGQLEFEKQHLLKKLETRDFKKYNEIIKIQSLEAHPMFIVVNGNIEKWEKH